MPIHRAAFNDRPVIARLPRSAIVRLLSLLLLATIGLQASEPVRGLQYERGSAFSAATSDVALAASRRGEAAQHAVAPLPSHTFEVALADAEAPLLLGTPLARPDSTGPPIPAKLARPSPPRAPPLLT